MGIKYLWQIFAPYSEKKSLYELQGKKLAIDLSCWICEAKNIADYSVQPRMYLRNLFFRTTHLLLLDVQPVFVLEGKAPELKYATIQARNALQFRGDAPKNDKIKTGKGRTRFHFTLKQCEELLECMGLKCVKGQGEAEALCGHLNADGLVDGIISQDSDCFAYGARLVYRNFSTSPTHASGASIDVYDMKKIEQQTHMGRNKMIALALICGSDYSDGLDGIGKDSAMKLLDQIDDNFIFQHLKSWKLNVEKYEDLEQKFLEKNRCNTCGHSGKTHQKNGCRECHTMQACIDNKISLQLMKNELKLRKKAIENSDFPNQQLIDEFLERKDNVSVLDLKWRQPDMKKFIKFTVKYLTWTEIYAFEKFLPILTRWQLSNSQSDKFILKIDHIKKKRNPKGVPSYEIIWQENEQLTQLIPEEQLENIDKIQLYTTIEPEELLNLKCRESIQMFNDSKRKKRGKNTKKIDEITEKLMNTSITQSPPIKKKPQKPNYLMKALKNATPRRCLSELNVSDFMDEGDADLSGLVDEIIGKNQQEFYDENLRKYGLKCVKNLDDSFVLDEYIPLYDRIKNANNYK